MWQEKNNSLYQKFEFKDFDEAFDFIQKVAVHAKGMDHHPTITNTFNVVELELSTHDAGKVTGKDRQLAEKIDEILKLKTHEPNTEIAKARLFTDGGSRGNPGPSAIGYVILDHEEHIIKKEGIYIGITTNNQAEYRALKAGLEDAVNMGVKELDVYMDSMLVVNQIKGEWKLKNQDLTPIYTAVKSLIPEFENISFSHVPRAMNQIADGMVNECLDSQ
jgi:ribonuclease HI